MLELQGGDSAGERSNLSARSGSPLCANRLQSESLGRTAESELILRDYSSIT